jgi:putative transposase
VSSYSRIFLHICFHSRNNETWLSKERETELIPFIAKVLIGIGAKLVIGACSDNHVHLLVKSPPRMSVEELVRRMKGASVHWVHRRWPELTNAGWQHGYSAFSVDYRKLRPVYEYLKNQRLHHQPEAGITPE